MTSFTILRVQISRGLHSPLLIKFSSSKIRINQDTIFLSHPLFHKWLPQFCDFTTRRLRKVQSYHMTSFPSDLGNRNPNFLCTSDPHVPFLVHAPRQEISSKHTCLAQRHVKYREPPKTLMVKLTLLILSWIFERSIILWTQLIPLLKSLYTFIGATFQSTTSPN